MNGEKTIAVTGTTGGQKMLTAMVGIGVLCALLIVVTYEGTRDRISMLRANALQEAIFKVVPGVRHTRSFQIDANGKIHATGNPDPTRPQIFAGYDMAGELAGFAIEASGQGYADVIRILYGYDPESGQIVGFHVLESKETPGLGDKIEKDPDFLENFMHLDASLDESGKALKHRITTVKNNTRENPWEIDGITGATISSRAIGAIVDASAAELLPAIHSQMDVFVNDLTNQE